MSDLEKLILIQAGVKDLARGRTSNDVPCPWCGKDKSFSVTKTLKGDILFLCHRARCGESGYIRCYGSGDTSATQEPEFCPRVYDSPTRFLEGERLSQLLDTYHLRQGEVDWAGFLYNPSRDSLVMPVYCPYGTRRGTVTKAFDSTIIPKTINYKEVDENWLGWYIREGVCSANKEGKFDIVVVVEDAISAVKASRYVPSVALYGTNLNPDAIDELRSNGHKTYLAFDKDATAKAYHYVKEYGLLGNFRLLPLSKDLKDMDDHELTVWSQRLNRG